MNDWRVEDWVLLITAFTAAITSIIAALRSNVAAKESIKATNIVNSTNQSVNDKMDTMLIASKTIATSIERAAGVIAGEVDK